MLRTVRYLRDELLKLHPAGEFELEDIHQIICGLSTIDEVVYVSYDSEWTNPIWGSFARWSHQPGAYVSFQTKVEIRYASHLSEEWLRLVVCKELCHALDTSEGSHSITPDAIDVIVKQFALLSARQKPDRKAGKPFQSELLAESAAVELLCPMPVRRGLMADGMDLEVMAAKFKIPFLYLEASSEPGFMDMVERFMNEG